MNNLKIILLICFYILLIYRYRLIIFDGRLIFFKYKLKNWAWRSITRKNLIRFFVIAMVALLLIYWLRKHWDVDIYYDILDLIYAICVVLTSYIIDIIFSPNFMMPSDSAFPPPNPNDTPTRLPTDTLELPSHIRDPAWNRPKPEDIPPGEAGKAFTARYGRGEPMDIAMPTEGDKMHLHNVISATYNYRTTRPLLPSDPQMVTMLDVLNTLQKDGAGTNGFPAAGNHEDDRAFAVAKQLRKIIYNEHRFQKWIHPNSNRIGWAYIKASPNSELMKYLRSQPGFY